MKTQTPPIASKEIGNKTAVLYSVEQDCFHLETVYDYINLNVRRCLIQAKCNEYRLICICNSDIEGDAFIEKFRKLQQDFKDRTLDDLINKALDNE